MPSLSSKTASNAKKALSLEAKREQFENSKYSNFASSSKLEGINITQVEQDLEKLIAKYQAIGNAQHGR